MGGIDIKHTTNEVVMVRPKGFFFNAQTAVNNAYQHNDEADLNEVQKRALEEFNNLSDALKAKGVKVNILEDTAEPKTPDSIFPNNWFSTHEGGIICIYPMFAENRQMEILKFKEKVVKICKDKAKDEEFFKIFDYSENHDKNKFLEGTGSIVIDRKNKVAYCSLSPRADKNLFETWCKDTGHVGVTFESRQDGQLIYHTNIVMGIGEKKAIICLEAIDEKDRQRVKDKLIEGGNDIVELTLEQTKACAGNTLELMGSDGKSFIVMSKMAYDSLDKDQIKKIEETTEIVCVDISTIEYYGGGSARCMIAEIF